MTAFHSMNDMELLCIFTPTYERAFCLPNLFESLKQQKALNFRWLIVDDGSTDNTEEVVEGFMAASPFPIEYIKQENGGKQRAHNTGVAHCENELFFCVDSDDVLPPHVTEEIERQWSDAASDRTIAGLVGLCGGRDGKPLGTSMPRGVSTLTFWDLYYKYGHKGDSAPIYRTEILKQFPFDVEPGEKFIAEPYVYHQIDQHYCLRVVDKILMTREYLSDGYTSNVRKVTKENPIGYKKLKLMYIGYSDTLYLQFYKSILYQVGCILSNTKHGSAASPHRFVTALAWLPAYILVKTVYR